LKRTADIKKGGEGPRSGYAPVNGLEMYYECHGAGKPLVLLHGGAGTADMFAAIMPRLAERRRVVAAELQAHGHTADIDRPLRYETMADDVAALTRHLKLGKVDLMGYSLGGGVALRVAIQHPGLVRKLVLVSVTFKRRGWYPEILAAMASGAESAEELKQSPMYRAYEKVAPRLQDWPVLMGKLAEMLKREYDWSAEVARMEVPTMIAVGDADSVQTSHAVEFFGLLGGGKKDGGWDGSGMSRARLLVLPGVTHYTIFSSLALASTVVEFLDAPMPDSRR
jgi:pimeloyl-ACP methyl ester carboxylesterase